MCIPPWLPPKTSTPPVRLEMSGDLLSICSPCTALLTPRIVVWKCSRSQFQQVGRQVPSVSRPYDRVQRVVSIQKLRDKLRNEVDKLTEKKKTKKKNTCEHICIGTKSESLKVSERYSDNLGMTALAYISSASNLSYRKERSG